MLNYQRVPHLQLLSSGISKRFGAAYRRSPWHPGEDPHFSRLCHEFTRPTCSPIVERTPWISFMYIYIIYIHLYNIYLHLFPSIKQHLCPPVQSRYPNIPEGSCAHISPWLPMNTPIVHGWLIHFPIFWTVPRKIPFAGYNTTCGCDRFKPIVPIGDS